MKNRVPNKTNALRKHSNPIYKKIKSTLSANKKRT